MCGLDCGEAQFDAPSGIGVEWEEGGAEPFGPPVYPSPEDWLAPLLLLVYENNEHVPAPTSPNQPTVRLETADGQVLVTQTFTILKRLTLDPPTGLVPHNASSATADDGSISGVDVNTMEWQTESPQTQPYQPIPASPWTGLTPGTYRIRFKETDDHIASNAATVTVGYNQPPSPGGGGSGGGGGGGGGGGLGTVSLGNPSTPYAPIGETIPNIPAQLVVDTVSNTTKAVTLENGVTSYVKGWGFVHDNVNNADNWYYFNPTTDLMETGWLTEKGNVYYLHTNEDYLKGRVYSGWHNISGIVYYFSETNYALELMLSLSEAQSHGIITYEDSIAAFQEGRILEATHGTMGLETMNSNVDQQSAAQAQAQLQLQIQNAVTTELVREALAARQDIIRAIERGALSIEDAYAMSGGQIPAIDYKSNMQSNQEIINQIANLIAAFR